MFHLIQPNQLALKVSKPTPPYCANCFQLLFTSKAIYSIINHLTARIYRSNEKHRQATRRYGTCIPVKPLPVRTVRDMNRLTLKYPLVFFLALAGVQIFVVCRVKCENEFTSHLEISECTLKYVAANCMVAQRNAR